MKLKITLILFLIINSNSLFAQLIKNEQKIINEKNYTVEQKETLNYFLNNGNYKDFYSNIQLIDVSKKNYINFLLSKSDEGIIPIYWLISDFYAKEKNDPETHKWFYISLIMTQQDSYLCYDTTARNAPRILMKNFPDSIDVTRKTPQHIELAMKEVSFFIKNLKTRIDPKWVCSYGENPVKGNNNVTIIQSLWKEERNKVLKNFTDKYNQ